MRLRELISICSVSATLKTPITLDKHGVHLFDKRLTFPCDETVFHLYATCLAPTPTKTLSAVPAISGGSVSLALSPSSVRGVVPSAADFPPARPVVVPSTAGFPSTRPGAVPSAVDSAWRDANGAWH